MWNRGEDKEQHIKERFEQTNNDSDKKNNTPKINREKLKENAN